MRKEKKQINETELMSAMPVPRAVAKMAIPCVISSLVTVVYNIADTFFVGQTNDALQVAAVSLTNPIFVLMMACATMLGMGGSALASRMFGAGDEEKGKNASAVVMYGSLAIGVVFLAVLLICTGPVLSMLGANEETYAFARGYTIYIALGAPFIIASATISYIVRAEGASTEAMLGSMIGTFANIILDPIMISGLHMGAAGAAIATTLGNLLAFLYYLYYFLRKSQKFSLHPRYITFRKSVLGVICRDGCPSAIFSVLQSVSIMILNQILVAYGNEPVAAIGIVFKLNMFMAFLQMGLANGVQPLLGYCYGAGNTERFRKVERFTKVCCLIVGTASTLLFFFLRTPLIRVFLDDEKVVYYGVLMLTAYVLSGPILGILFVNMNCMQSIGRSMPSMVLAIMRQGALYLPVLFLFRAIWGMNGIVAAQSVTDWAAMLFSIVFWVRMRKYLKPDSLESQSKI